MLDSTDKAIEARLKDLSQIVRLLSLIWFHNQRVRDRGLGDEWLINVDDESGWRDE